MILDPGFDKPFHLNSLSLIRRQRQDALSAEQDGGYGRRNQAKPAPAATLEANRQKKAGC
jgi:hypothetical protein